MAAQGGAFGFLDAGDGISDGFIGHRHRVPVGMDQALAVNGQGDVAFPEQKISAFKVVLHHATCGFLQVCIGGQGNAAGQMGYLREARAIQPSALIATP